MRDKMAYTGNNSEIRKYIRVGATIGTWFAVGYLFAFMVDAPLIGIDLPAYIWYPLCSSLGVVLGVVSLIFRARRREATS